MPRYDTRENRLNQIYRFIVKYHEENGVTPQLSEISTAMGIQIRSVSGYLVDLEKAGKIRRTGGVRGIEITEDSNG